MSRLLNAIVLVVYFLVPLNVYAASSLLNSDKDYVIPVKANEFKIMSYNVQNLFDATHDADKNDYEFLPKDSPHKKNCESQRNAKTCAAQDWTNERVALKIEQIKKAIAAQGDLPDVLVLVEVENRKIISKLAKALGYKDFEMTNSPDARGIDCAVLYLREKLTLIDYFEQPVEDAASPTRNLSAAIFKLSAELGGEHIAIFPNHWPSQGNPVEARIIVANALRNFIEEIKTENKTQFSNLHLVLTGDFNVVDEDKPHPIKSVLLDKNWDLKLFDVRTLAVKKKNPMIPKMPQATYFYGVENVWQEFDRFIVNTELNDGRGLEVDPMSYRINAPAFLTKKNDKNEAIPFRYNHNSSSKAHIGYSDHFGIVVKFSYKK